ncbi:MAG: tetratricopeptide repeat protein, partial [Chromatiales bacterium]
YFADGITDGLITELSRLSELFVISRHSSFVYKGLSKRAEEIGTELGVRYLLEGSVQRSGERVRITTQLVDTTSDAYLWAERYDRELKDIFAVQDDVTRRIVAVLQVKLSGTEQERIGHEGTVSIEAHDALLRGLERFWVYTPASVEEARALLAKAIELDPRYAFAHACLARTLAFQWIFFLDPRDETLERAFECARTAVDLDPQTPSAYSVLCWVQLWRKQGEAAIAAGWRAVALDPNNADAYLFLSMTLAAAGRGEEALHSIETGMRLNPHPSAFYQFALGFCYFVLEEYDKAIAAFKRGTGLTDVFIPNHFWLCVVYTLLEREEEARIEREKVLALSGGRKPAVQGIWLDEDLRLREQGLIQLAGLA